MVSVVLILLVFRLFLFPNRLFFVFSLLLIVFWCVLGSVKLGILSVLVALLICIIYVGAIIIIIGYVCAVAPNVGVSASLSISPLLLALVGGGLSLTRSGVPAVPACLADLGRVLYSYYGWLFLSLTVAMLFFVLLIVTSQFYNPAGPFRSLNQ